MPAPVGTPPKEMLWVGGRAYVATPELTTCNCAATCFCACFGAELPPVKANDQAVWLKSNEAQMLGWKLQPDRELARQRIMLGSLIVFVASNPLGHGHIGCGVPYPLAPNELHVTAAGAHNYVTAKLEQSFGALAPSALAFEHLLKVA